MILIFKCIFTIIILLILLGFIGFTLFTLGGKNRDNWYKLSIVSFISAAVIVVTGFLGMIWLT